uniref:Orf77 protein n=1 Tax=Moineauvirus Sfi21 TaxID=64186 RepID=O21983_9CAUD|nr:orf77 [Moineauvirus Sfi21]
MFSSFTHFSFYSLEFSYASVSFFSISPSNFHSFRDVFDSFTTEFLNCFFSDFPCVCHNFFHFVYLSLYLMYTLYLTC